MYQLAVLRSVVQASAVFAVSVAGGVAAIVEGWKKMADVTKKMIERTERNGSDHMMIKTVAKGRQHHWEKARRMIQGKQLQMHQKKKTERMMNKKMKKQAEFDLENHH